MSSEPQNVKFPGKKPIRKMRQVIDSEELHGIQSTAADGDTLAELPIQMRPKNLVPRVFKIPAQTLGLGISTIARLFGLGVIFRTVPEVDEEKNG